MLDKRIVWLAAQAMAEREAWRLAKEKGLDLVAVLPNFVLGPVLSARTDGLSAGFLKVCTPCCMPCLCAILCASRAFCVFGLRCPHHVMP